ncbi:MAG: hypothetical protein M3Y45_07935 [Actinomycetota bacterium]|nr:hypothetical protein [Actinomycetota bacterium]
MVASTGSGAEPGKPGSSSGHWRHLPLITVALLAVGTVLAFGYSQRLKREPLVVDRVEFVASGATADGPRRTVFSPNGDCRRDRMTINFRTTKTDRADVEIIGPGGRPVRVLARDRFFKRYREHRLIWDGRKDNNRIPKTGRFRVRVTMHGLDRVLYLPGRIRLHNYVPPDSACPDDRSGVRPESQAGSERTNQ